MLHAFIHMSVHIYAQATLLRASQLEVKASFTLQQDGIVFASNSRFSFLISHIVIPAVATPMTRMTAPQIPHRAPSLIEIFGDLPESTIM